MDPLAAKYIAAGMCMMIGSIAPAMAEGWVAKTALEAMGRNPEISDKLFANMVVAMAICESTGIYCLVISLILLFVA
jgi:F-type H+-transporting ATPase subunit c